MELRHVKEFVVLAEHCSFAEAADKLYISQSSLSRHIQLLEEELGASLFNRTTRKVSLTECGELFLAHAGEMLAAEKQCLSAIHAQLNREQSTLFVGTIPGMIRHHIMEIVNAFNGNRYGWKLRLLELQGLDAWDALKNKTCDMAFVRYGEKSTGDYRIIPHAKEEVVVLLPCEHPLAEGDCVSLEALGREKLILLSPGTAVHHLCMEAFRNREIDPQVVYTGHTLSNIMDFVACGLGVALLSGVSLHGAEERGLVCLPVSPEISTSIALCYPETAILSPAARYFEECTRRYSRVES